MKVFINGTEVLLVPTYFGVNGSEVYVRFTNQSTSETSYVLGGTKWWYAII